MRKVPNLAPEKAKISFQELSKERPKDLMKFYGMSERAIEKQVHHHCGDATQKEQKKVYEEVYGHGRHRKN